jgi:hypothetical protein
MRWVVLLVVGLVSSSVFGQAPLPTIEVRIHSIVELLPVVEFAGKMFGQPEPAKQAAEFIKSQIDPERGLDGIDPKRPWGLYAVMTKDVIDSPVILMIPITDGEAFLDLIRGKLSLDPKKDKDGVYQLDVPNVPVPVFFRLTKTQALVTVQFAKNLEAKNIIPEKEFFAEKDEAQLSSKVHFSRMPDEVKKVVFGQWELQANDGMKRARPGESASETLIRQWALKESLPAIHATLFQGETFRLGVHLNTSKYKNEVALGTSFTAKAGTPLATQLATLGTRPGVALPAISGDAMFRLGANLAMMPEMQKSFAALLQKLYDLELAKAKDNDKIVLTLGYNTLQPTFAAGELNLQMAVIGGSSQQFHTALVAKTVEGQEIANLAKLGSSAVPKDQAKLTFDVKKIDGMKLHQAEVFAPEFEKSTGVKKVFLGTGESRFVMAVHPNEGLAESIVATPAKVQKPLELSLAIGKFGMLVDQKLPKDTLAEMYRECFPDKEVPMRLELTGGKEMQLNLRLHADTVRFLYMVGKATENR